MIEPVNIVRIVIGLLSVLVGISFMKRGYRRGAMGELRSLLGILVALVCIALIMIIRRAVSEQTYATVIVVGASLVILSAGWKLIRMILGLLDGITELPVIGFVNRLLGALMGAAECVAIIWIVYKMYSVVL